MSSIVPIIILNIKIEEIMNDFQRWMIKLEEVVLWS